MRKHFTSDEAAQFLRNARMGGILTPNQLRSEIQHVEQRPAIGNYAVGASVPNWLVEKLEPAKRLAHNYTVYRFTRLLPQQALGAVVHDVFAGMNRR